MELEKIKKLYENVEVSTLSEREKLLTELLFADHSVSDFDLPQGRYRVLQFANRDFEELERTLKLLLPDFVCSVQTKKIVIEAFSSDSPTKSELIDIFQTLSQDMGERISAYVGLFVDRSKLEENYHEEVKIFNAQKTFSEYALSESLTQFDNQALKQIREMLLENPDDQNLIKALYVTNGNQSQAAKNLYVHRNTLLNKIKKYEQKYGLQLTGSDLVLAYNLF